MSRLLLFLYLTAFVSAQETMIREVFDPATDTHVEVIALFSQPSPGGYFPVRVNAANNLPQDRSINLDFHSGNRYGGGINARSSFHFKVPAGKTLAQDILVPLGPANVSYGDASINVTLSGGFGIGQNSIQSNQDRSQPANLLSEALFTPNASTLDAAFASKFSGSYGGSATFAAKFDPKQLPGDWRAYSGYDNILMTDLDWSNASPAARTAMISWLHLGGQLIICHTATATSASLGIPENHGFGQLTLQPVSSDLKLDEAEIVEQVTGEKTLPPQRLSIANDFNSLWPLQEEFGTRAFRYEVFIVILIAFGILVGPVNLFVFAKSGKRHRLFITTPLISLGASAILIALILFQDGFGGSGTRLVLMEVGGETGQNAAFIQQQQFSRTGVLTRSNFTIDTPATFSPVPIKQSRWARYTDSDPKGNFNLQPVDGKLNASGDWFQSRSEHGHILTAVVPTRGRIESTDAENVLVSTFDFPIETLYFLGSNNQMFRADAITPGKRFTLKPVVVKAGSNPKLVIASAFPQRQRKQIILSFASPNRFLATTNDAPAIETHPGIDWKKTRTVITGSVVNP